MRRKRSLDAKSRAEDWRGESVHNPLEAVDRVSGWNEEGVQGRGCRGLHSG